MQIRIPTIVAALAVLACGACNTPPRGTPGPIVLVVVDTLRADHLGAYGYSRDTSPQLDAWAASGKLYERTVATAPWTAPSFGSLFTGELPSRHGVAGQERPDGTRIFGHLDPGVPTVAELLAERGYATAALVNNPFLSPEFGLDRGFERYDYEAGTNTTTRRADVMVDLALRFIDLQGDRPFFLVLHLFDPHMSYDAPPPFAGRFTNGIDSELTLPFEAYNEVRSGELRLDDADKRFVAAAYDEEVAFVDHELGRLRRELARRGLDRRGLVIVTADHGEELFDHGGFEHGHAMWEELLHVPLIVWGPGVRGGRETTPVSIADVAPTLLDFAGVEAPPTSGISLWRNATGDEPLHSRTLFAEQNLYGTELKAAMHWPYKLIVNTDGGDRWLFDLSTNPEERLLPWDDRVETADRLLGELTKRVEHDLESRLEQPPAELGTDTLEKLRSLGYVQ